MDRFHPMQIAHIKIGERHRKDLGDLESLAADIKENGMLHPIVVERDTRELIAGQRRLEAAKLLGWKKVTVHRVSMQEIVRGEFAENAERKDFLPTEIEAIRRAMEPVEKEAAKGRMGRGENQTPKGSTRDKVAKVAGVSGATADKIRKVSEAADRDPKKYGHLPKKMDETNVDRAYREMRRLERIETQDAAARDPGPLNKGRTYTVIYADVPWQEEAYSRENGLDRSPEAHYQTMPLDEIKALPVGDIAHKDSVLFFWAKANRMADAIDVIRAWGFTYKTQFIWLKEGGIGTGRWVRDKHEILCIATKGDRPPPPEGLLRESVFSAPRGGHSEKPAVAYEIIESYYQDSDKMELFARAARPGWDVWGNEIPAPISTAAQNCDGAVKQADDERGGAEPEAAIMGPQSPEDAKPGMGSLPGDDLEIPEFLRRT